MQAMAAAVRSRYDLAGRRIVVTAGGTREPIDPVRYIGNYSSGRMGFALAAAAADRGARVDLVTTVSHPKHRGVETHAVETADDMLADLRFRIRGADALVMAAAVADFRPAHREGHKIRREETPHLALDLEPIPDLLAALAHGPEAKGVLMVGFAAEGSDLDAKAADKLKRKGLDAIVANDISRHDIGFGSEYNEGVMLFADGQREALPRMTKREMADRILDLVRPRLHQD
jgi:phosphopantothenoylcysteine decarboxylase/phosphopantothenate--cysteine ligase